MQALLRLVLSSPLFPGVRGERASRHWQSKAPRPCQAYHWQLKGALCHVRYMRCARSLAIRGSFGSWLEKPHKFLIKSRLGYSGLY